MKKSLHRPLFLLLLLASGISHGAVVGFATSNPDGSYTYSFEVTNAGSFDIFQWSLDFDFEAADRDWDPNDVLAGGDVTVPLGDPGDFFDDWQAGAGIPIAGLSTQDFLSSDPLGSGDILMGSTLSGFSFTSFLPPGPVTYFEFGPSGQSATGTTIGPIIPEPSLALLLPLAALTMARRSRR